MRRRGARHVRVDRVPLPRTVAERRLHLRRLQPRFLTLTLTLTLALTLILILTLTLILTLNLILTLALTLP